MAESLSWQAEGDTLCLQGELDRDTLPALWDQRDAVLSGIRFLDVSRLHRVDSAGVAMMLHLCVSRAEQDGALALTGVTEKLRTLITLYKLQDILPCVQDKPA
ncbi:lipid asymmetry maintenance protein MlaB [Acerihabitans sp. KWT182]|uniref:Lipid asymmetry maintenance protein MlaB n=1 Tax=Acerihabitans sp. KWT182 TaxID=3157919 RepID=A0AAU7QAG6_9GAMM